jgi:cytoskeletal protein CcmA (bactofilin family)
LIRSGCVQPAYLLKKIIMNTFEKIIALNRFFYRTSIDIQTVIDGKFQFSGKLLLDGMVNGELEGRDHENTTAVVGPTGKVNGDIKCRTIMVAGTVYGDVYAESVFLMEGARIFGDLHYDKLEVDHRAIVNGRFVLRGESAETRLPSFTQGMQFIPKVEVGMNLPIAGI